MDELFRRAASDYPLNTDSADWNAVIKKMAEQAPPSRDNRKHLLWLLLLIPAGLAFYYFGINPGRGASPENNKEASIKNNATADKVKSNTAVINTNTQQQKIDPSQSKQLVITSNISSNQQETRTGSVFQRRSPGKLKMEITSTADENRPVELITTQSDKKSNGSDIKTPDVNNNKTEAQEKGHQPQIEKDANADVVIDKPVDKVQPAETENEKEIGAKKNKANTQKKKDRGLYAGVVYSPDISTIKFQSIKKVGSNLGVVVGYRFRNNISVESGAIWDVKNYYSHGQYFDTKKIHIPANAVINQVDGSCRMVEIPVNVKYNVGKSKHFSVSAGISSYIMKKEKYTYDITRNGSRYPYSATYKNSSDHFAAIANLAAGYEKEWKGITLRLQPYVKIPLKGMGIGSVPITSTGINIGLTKKLTR
jgi:hypothetical protein